MDKPSIWWSNTPFRKRLLDRVTKQYYSTFFGELKGKRVLEIGCGSGFGVEIILKYFAPRNIIATDFDLRQITQAKKNVQTKEVIFEQADATKLRYKNKSFDAIFDYGVIHHIPTPAWRKCLDEMYRVLKPGGKVFLYDLSIESFNTIHGKIIRLLSVHPYDEMYRKKEFMGYLLSVGFKILQKVDESRYFSIVAEK